MAICLRYRGPAAAGAVDDAARAPDAMTYQQSLHSCPRSLTRPTRPMRRLIVQEAARSAAASPSPSKRPSSDPEPICPKPARRGRQRLQIAPTPKRIGCFGYSSPRATPDCLLWYHHLPFPFEPALPKPAKLRLCDARVLPIPRLAAGLTPEQRAAMTTAMDVADAQIFFRATACSPPW